jgi:ankyrin repeat protein
MKLKSGIFILLLAGLVASAQTNNLTALLQQGLFEEQANRNLDAAIADYQSLATQFDQDRPMAATAVFRLGECYRAQGKTNEAAAQYQRILRDFSDQAMLATLSRQNLAGMGTSLESPASAARQQQKELLAKQIALAEQDLSDAQMRYKSGQAPQADVRNAGREVLRLRQQLVTLDAGKAELLDLSAPVTSEEDQEIARIQTMIQNSPDLINAAQTGGTTPLNGVARSGWIKVATFLLDHGADINLTSGGKETPLLAAAGAGNRAMVELLLSRGADVNAKDDAGETALHKAAGHGFQAVTEVLLANHADVNAPSVGGATPLCSAVQGSRVKIVQMLLGAGANVNYKQSNGSTVLNYAIKTSSEIFKVLLDAGTNPNTEDEKGRTPLSYAVERDNSEVVKLLLDAKADSNGGKLDAPLFCAIHNHDVGKAELLLKAGANPNMRGGIDWSEGSNAYDFQSVKRHLTPLWLANYWDQLPTVQLLLKYKADPNDSQTDGQSLLFSALSHTNILEALLDAGAKVDPVSTDDYQWTPLCVAANKNIAPAVEILLQHGANPNVCNQNGSTPLHWAAYHLADSKVFELLLANKADPNVRDTEGNTPLNRIKRILADGSTKGKNLAAEIADLLHQHGALDKLPDWDHITVSRSSANFSTTVFFKGTNGWNQFTLLETLLKYYYPVTPAANAYAPGFALIQNPNAYTGNLAFPDLTRVIIVRPNHSSTNETRIVVNLLNSTNGIDGSKDVPLEFGDVVEIPERDHSLGDRPVGLTDSQCDNIANYLKGNVQLVVRDQKTELTLNPRDAAIHSVLNQTEAQKYLLSSSDLARVKVSRHDPKTGKKLEWILDCSGSNAPDLWLRNGDVIEVPEKP